MQMLSHWIQDPSSDARIRVLEGSDASQTNSQVARITNTNAFVRVRPDTGDYPDALNWVRMGPGMAALSWCASMLKNMGYALPEEGSFVIRYDDGAFNHGPHGTDVNGFTVDLSEASRYESIEQANEKLQDLLYSDGTVAKVVCVRDLHLS